MADLVPEEAIEVVDSAARRAAMDMARETWANLYPEPADEASADFQRAVLATAVAKAVEAAAPLIVAAELTRLADVVEGQPVELADLMGAGKQYNAGKGFVAGLLRRRARELSVVSDGE